MRPSSASESKKPRALAGVVAFIAYVASVVVYVVPLTASKWSRLIPRRRWRPSGRIAVIGTFHNPGWYLSHLVPLSRSGIAEVVVVTEEPQTPLDRVRFACPPRWALLILGRALAKLLCLVITGIRYRPDLYMGYYLLPNACSALLAASVFRRPACYQATAGPLEIVGGGICGENWASTALSRPSAFFERLATAVACQFDLVVVRGRKAKAFLEERGFKRTLAIITGSIDPKLAASCTDRFYDMVFVGRLTELKQPQQFVEILAAVVQSVPSVHGAVVGDGPLLEALQVQAAELNVSDHICFLGKRADVNSILADARIFVLTSRSEGLSIAMAEAMGAGAVPVVADVGELGDLVKDDVNGFLVKPNDTGMFTQRVVALLQDRGLWARCSEAARADSLKSCSVPVVAQQWSRCLRDVVDRHPAVIADERSCHCD